MRSIITFAGLALAASILVPRYAAHMGDAPAPVAMTTHPQVSAASNAANPRSVVVPRDGRDILRSMPASTAGTSILWSIPGRR